MKVPLPSAIFLDLDDTIVEFSALREDYWNKVTKEFAAEISPVKHGELSSEILIKGDWFWADNERNKKWRLNLRQARQKIVELAFEGLGLEDFSLAHRIADNFSDLRERGENMIALVPGGLDTIRYFKERGVKLALLTNGSSKSQRNKIEMFNLAHLFDHILIEEEIGFGKPDDRIYMEALDRLGVEAEDTWMIGDNILWDVVAPQKLGIKGIWVNFKNSEKAENVDPFLTIKSLPEIMDHVH